MQIGDDCHLIGWKVFGRTDVVESESQITEHFPEKWSMQIRGVVCHPGKAT